MAEDDTAKRSHEAIKMMYKALAQPHFEPQTVQVLQAHALCRIADALETLATASCVDSFDRIADALPEEFPKAVIEHMCRQTLEMRRIADALERLSPPETIDELIPPAFPDATARCENCHGLGLQGASFCSCQTGEDLQRQEKRQGHLEA
jgi:hypothetical protein